MCRCTLVLLVLLFVEQLFFTLSRRSLLKEAGKLLLRGRFVPLLREISDCVEAAASFRQSRSGCPTLAGVGFCPPPSAHGFAGLRSGLEVS